MKIGGVEIRARCGFLKLREFSQPFSFREREKLLRQTMLEIRLAKPSDVDLLSTLGVSTFVATSDEIIPQLSELSRDIANSTFKKSKLEIDFKDSDINHYLILSNGREVGYARTNAKMPPPEIQFRKSLEIERIYLTKEAQGKGAGKYAIEFFARLAAQNGFRSLWLAVFDQNIKAISFYSKVGFVNVGSREFKFDWKGKPYQDTDLLFELSFDAK